MVRFAEGLDELELEGAHFEGAVDPGKVREVAGEGGAVEEGETATTWGVASTE